MRCPYCQSEDTQVKDSRPAEDGSAIRRRAVHYPSGDGKPLAETYDHAMTMYDKSQHNGTELRAFAGNFLFSTGSNENAGRFTACHFDFPMRHCTVELDGKVVVERGRLIKELL